MLTSRRQGIALIVVLCIILALMLVATPFLVSMLAHERSSQAYLMEEHAELNAETARNSVVTYLYLTGEAAERAHEKKLLNPTHTTYAYDLPIELTPAFGSALPEFIPPSDHLSGVNVQDEQGKVNLKTAPPSIVDALTRTAAVTGARLSDYFTIYSGREAAWIKPQNIRAIDSTGFYVDDSTPYGPGARLTISKRGSPAILTVVTAQVPLANTDPPMFAVVTNPAVPDTYLDGVVELEARHPVNVLTASEDVLTALFSGLTFAPDFEVSPQEAAMLARELRAAPPTSFGDFAAIVQSMTNYGWAQEEVDLVLRAAVNPTDASVGGGTLPICFRTHDAFLIDAAGAVVPSPGFQTAMRSFREIVQLAPPYPVTWDLESQYDFQRLLGDTGLFPFGNKLFTTPGTATMPDTALDPASLDQVEVRQIHAEDMRANATLRDHFPGEVNGLELAADEVVSYDWGQVFVPDAPYFDVRAGGFEMWFRFEDEVPTTAVLFDVRRADYADRISVEYVDGEMQLSAADTGMPTVYVGAARTVGGLARVTAPFSPKPNTWYHVGAYWKSTRYAHLALLIDGFAHPDSRFEHVDEDGRALTTTVEGGVAIGSTSIMLRSSALLAPDGITVLEIGREVVEYDPLTKTYARGARGTYDANNPTTQQLQQHPAGAKVSIFGYSQKLHAGPLPGPLQQIQVDTLTTGGALTTSEFGDTIGVNLETGVVGYATTTADLAPTAMSIGALYPTPDEFADDGYILIVSGNIQTGNVNIEVIKYADRAVTGGTVTFSGITRAQFGTTLPTNALQTHPAPAWVFPYSIKVTDNTNYPDPCIIQIGDEWFPVRKDPSDKQYFVSLRLRGFHFPLARAAFKTEAEAHVLDEKVIPVFATKATDWNRLSDYQAGRDDRVTIIDSNLNRRLRRIHHATSEARVKIDLPNLYNIDQTYNLNTQLVAFDDWVDVAYSAGDNEARLLKFPSGELLSARVLQDTNPLVDLGSGCTHVDEVKFYASPKGDFRSAQSVGVTEQAVPMNAPAALSPNGGVVKIGDEFVGYAQIDGANLGRCTRGYLGSKPQVHDLDRAFNFTGLLAVATVLGGATADSDVIPLSQPIVANAEGYVLIEEEVVGYTALAGNALLMPRTADGKGLYRGRFGTTPAQHGPNALAYAIPFRWWDTSVPGEFDNTMAYVQAGTTVREATWHTFRYDLAPPELDDEDEPMPGIRAAVKVGARGSWTDIANDSQSALFEFDEPGVDHPLRYLRGDTFDVRFFWSYPEGSFYPADTWKRDARLKSASARHHSVTQTLVHEE